MQILISFFSFHTSDDIQVKEDVLGFVDVTGQTTGEDIASNIVTYLRDVGLDLNLLRGQCYDGAGTIIMEFMIIISILVFHQF